MEKETRIRIGLLLQSAIQDTGANQAEAVFAFYCPEENNIALVPVERYGSAEDIPEIKELMAGEGLDRFDAIERVASTEGFTLLGLLAVRVAEGRQASIQYEEVPGVPTEQIEAAKQIFWDTLVQEGKFTPVADGA